MRDIHPIFTSFKQEFPAIHEKYESLGQSVHLEGGPLDERERALIKIAIAGAGGHQRALETHVYSAREAGCSEAEIEHTLLLLISSSGFPAFMEAYSTYKGTL